MTDERFDILQFFRLTKEEMEEILVSKGRRNQDAFFGDSVLRYCLTIFILNQCKDTKNSETIKTLSEKRSVLGSNFILTTFLLKATNFFTKYCNEKEETVEILSNFHYWGTVVEALIWNSNKDNLHPLNLQPWNSVIEPICAWIEKHIDWKAIKKNDLKEMDVGMSTSSMEEEKSKTLEIGVKADQLLKKVSKFTKLNLTIHDVMTEQRVVETSSLVPGKSIAKLVPVSQTSQITPPESQTRRLVIKSASSLACIPAKNKLQATAEIVELRKDRSDNVKSLTVTSDPVKNKLPSTEIVEFRKVVPESLSATTESHCWDYFTTRHKQIKFSPVSYTATTWEGAECLICGCFNVIRKRSNQYSDHIILGAKSCPGNYCDWLTSYRLLLESGQIKLGRISQQDLYSWGYLGQEVIMRKCTECGSSKVRVDVTTCSNKYPCKYSHCSNKYPCKMQRENIKCLECSPASIPELDLKAFDDLSLPTDQFKLTVSKKSRNRIIIDRETLNAIKI